jgi:hypothetical protein
MDRPPLAKRHTGMRLNIEAHLVGPRRRGTKWALEQLHEHLKEVARRYYAGDIAVVDEFLQAYCLDDERPEVTP